MERRERGRGGTTVESWKEWWEKEEGIGLEWSHGKKRGGRGGPREESWEKGRERRGRDGVRVESWKEEREGGR